MGNILRAKCSACGYDKTLFVGGGMNDIDPETAISMMNEDDAESFRNTIGTMGLFSIYRVPCRCLSCGCIYTGTEVRWNRDGTVKSVFNACPVCGSYEKEALSEKSVTICPECGKTVSFSGAGFWD